MYKGEVNVAQDHLPGLLKVAELLKVKGLVEEEREKLLNSGHVKVTSSNSANNSSSSDIFDNSDSGGSPLKKPHQVNGPSGGDKDSASSASMPPLPRPFMPTPPMGAPPFPQFPFNVLPGMFPSAAQVRTNTLIILHRERCFVDSKV